MNVLRPSRQSQLPHLHPAIATMRSPVDEDAASERQRENFDTFNLEIIVVYQYYGAKSNRPYAMPRQDNAALASPPATSRIAFVSDSIRSDILEARVAPSSRLHMGQLAERFDVSPSLVREALSRLVADGWVKAIDQRGFRVCPVSIEDLQDITRTRIDVESIALRRSIEAGDLAWEGRILAAYHELSGATPQRVEALKDSMLAWSVLHRRFHGALVSACGSPWLLRFRDTLTDQSERYRKLSVSYAMAPRDVDDEHKRIMQAALDRDADACIAEISKHFQQTADVVLASVQARLQDGDQGDAS